MPIDSGRRLGPYEIVAPIGAGGMGEVYRARDTRLDRSVAIKVLPSEFARDASLRVRFEREAKAISSLSHPHICTLFDVGHENGTDYIVMELLDGETLADRLSRGPMPMADVLRIGAQIAEALAAAHRHGIVHRDLKPGNIILTKSGAKLLDFGLARPVQDGIVNSHSAMTEQKPITEQGAIVGTFQYMSPEQLEGLPADSRTDIFALGAVLYEMATGRRAFEGKTRTSLVAAIVSAQPRPISEVQPLTPTSFEHVVRSCLEKDPNDRMQSAHDVAMELRWIGAGEAAVKRGGSSKLAWAVAAMFALLLLAFGAYHFRSRSAPPQAVRFTIPPPAGTNIHRTAAISPDGRRIVFRADMLDGSAGLYIRALDALTTTRLPVPTTNHVFWSPDGRHLGVMGGGALRRLDTADNSIRTLASGIATQASGATWGTGGVIVFADASEGPLRKISADGGTGSAATKMLPNESLHIWPWFLPDGRHFVYVVLGKQGTSGIYAGALDSDLHKRILAIGELPDLTRAVYANGRLFYIRNQALYGQEFDADALELRGRPVLIDEDLEMTGPLRTPLSVSTDGTLVYRKAGAVITDHIFIADRFGRDVAALRKPGPVNTARFSPDGRRVLVAYNDPIAATWIHDLDRGIETEVTDEMWAGVAAWASNDDSFVYSAVTDTPPNLFYKRPDGSKRRLTNGPRQNYISCVTPDGRLALYTTDDRGNTDVYAVPLDPPHTPVPILTSPARETNAEVSPDGRWLAYVSNGSGVVQIYVTSFPKSGRVWQISTERGELPRWSRDGKTLYYVDRSNDLIMAVKIEGPDFRPGRPQPLFELPGMPYDVGPDGNFLIMKPQLNPDAPHLTVLMNWQ